MTIPSRAAAYALSLLALTALAWRAADAQASPNATLATNFDQQVKPFLTQSCVQCHNADTAQSGIRLDNLDASLDERHLKLWEAMRHRISEGTMPPKGLPQPSAESRQRIVAWITQALEIARSRPAPKNGMARRLTVAQYRNTLRELLGLEDDLTEILPPDAVSKDGFLNNKETLQLSPLLLEAYLEIADEALTRSIVDPKSKPAVQNFRVDLGAAINPQPFPDPLILGANSQLLDNKDFIVTQLTAQKPFPFQPFFMKTKYRFIEGYQGNDTVRGWRDYDSIYHSVFACMRGSRGYPKGHAYDLVPQGLLLRPAIPNDEIFTADGTYGPKANFKISLRELPDNGRFRVTVLAAKYNDALVLDKDTAAAAGTLTARDLQNQQTVNIPQAGLYQVDVYAGAPVPPPAPDGSRLTESLSLNLPLDGELAHNARLNGKAKFSASPFGQSVTFEGADSSVVVPRNDALNVGTGDFTITAWVQPKLPRRGSLLARGTDGQQGWQLEMPDNRGVLRFETTGPANQANGTISSPPGTLRANSWHHVAAVVRRGPAGENRTLLYVNGYPVAKGDIGAANLDNAERDLEIGRMPGGGNLDEVRLYRRALASAELQALIEPGRKFVRPPAERTQDVTLTLGGHQYSSTLLQPAFLAVRLAAGPLTVKAANTGMSPLDRVTFTPLPAGDLTNRFLAFEKRVPRLGVHLGLRRDCGSTFAPVGPPQTVAGTDLKRYVFEGAIRNFPSPDVEKDNVNYLAGIREIAVRSEYTDGRDLPRLLIKSVEFEGPFYQAWPPATHSNIFIPSPNLANPTAYARDIVRAFAARAYRRPLTPAEETAPMAIFEKSFAEKRDFRQGVKDALQVVLTSPQFLFLIEKSATPAPEPLSPSELASKLSYFLTNSPPDRTTLSLAANGTLRSRLDAEVNRLVQDPRFSRFTREFVSQWLSLEKFAVLEPDKSKFPKLTRDTRAQLAQEPIHFVQHLFRENLPVKNLVSSDFIVANEVVANYYDLGGKTERGFDFVAIPHGRPELGGVMTQAAIMAGLSDGRESNPVKRGAWLARRIVAEPPDDPPPNVPALKEDAAGLTLRQRIEQHRNQPGCRPCHAKIDPWGVAFEEFDAGGRLKDKPADARSTLPDKTEVTGANDLKRYLAEDRIDQVAFSTLKHLFTYANGRNLTYQELNFLKQDGLKLRAQGYRMKDMVRYVVTSKLFLEK